MSNAEHKHYFTFSILEVDMKFVPLGSVVGGQDCVRKGADYISFAYYKNPSLLWVV
jgi:hypothetical protein